MTHESATFIITLSLVGMFLLGYLTQQWIKPFLQVFADLIAFVAKSFWEDVGQPTTTGLTNAGKATTNFILQVENLPYLILLLLFLPMTILGLFTKIVLERNARLNVDLNGHPILDRNGKLLRINPGPCFQPGRQ